jgi:hypothetical protein
MTRIMVEPKARRGERPADRDLEAGRAPARRGRTRAGGPGPVHASGLDPPARLKGGACRRRGSGGPRPTAVDGRHRDPQEEMRAPPAAGRSIQCRKYSWP